MVLVVLAGNGLHFKANQPVKPFIITSSCPCIYNQSTSSSLHPVPVYTTSQTFHHHFILSLYIQPVQPFHHYLILFLYRPPVQPFIITSSSPCVNPFIVLSYLILSLYIQLVNPSIVTPSCPFKC